MPFLQHLPPQEGYNSKTNGRLGQSHPSAGIQLTNVVREVREAESLLRKIRIGIPKTAKRKTYKMLATRRLNMKKTNIEDSKGRGDSKKEAIKRFLTNMGHNISKSVLLESSSLRVVAATRSKKNETIEDSFINHNTSSWQQIL